jgi:hypothetical protein
VARRVRTGRWNRRGRENSMTIQRSLESRMNHAPLVVADPCSQWADVVSLTMGTSVTTAISAPDAACNRRPYAHIPGNKDSEIREFRSQVCTTSTTRITNRRQDHQVHYGRQQPRAIGSESTEQLCDSQPIPNQAMRN